MATDNRPSGVSGWLLVLIVIMVLVSPIFVLMTASEYAKLAGTPALAVSLFGVWLFYTLRAFAYVAAGACLYFLKAPPSPKVAILVLWLAGPISVLAWHVFAVHIPLILPVAKACAPAVLWSAYLLLSKRVKNTYESGHDAIAAEA